MKIQDLYDRVTDRIIADLEKGVLPWNKPWNDAPLALPLRHNGMPYSGVNVLILWDSAMAQGFAPRIWMTFNQARELGGMVRKGQKGTPIVFASRFTKSEETSDGETVERSIRFMKSYTVFNVAQIDGLPEHYYATKGERPGFEPLEAAEAFVNATDARIVHGERGAFYSPKADYVGMPAPETFRARADYYSTLAHELTHWTGHESRLDRSFSDSKKFGDDGYAREELVAELGAAFACALLGISHEPRADHASYLDHWLRVLKADKRAIFSAAAHAQRAIDYLQRFQNSAAADSAAAA